MNRHLPTLPLLHYIYGALICFGGLAALLFLGVGTLLQSDLVAQDATPPPAWLGTFFQAFGVVLFVVIELWGVLVILSGRWIKQRRHRTASTIIAGLCLLSIPIGTALGIFTLIVLMDTNTRAEYEGRPVIA